MALDTLDMGLEPDDGECANCGGEGVLYDCFDSYCEDAEFGCDDCAYPCDWCRPIRKTQEDQLKKEDRF